MTAVQFEWDDNKDAENQAKHHVSFLDAQAAFADPHRVIAKDLVHSEAEERFLLHWQSGWRYFDGALYLQAQCHSNHWGRLLAQRKGNL